MLETLTESHASKPYMPGYGIGEDRESAGLLPSRWHFGWANYVREQGRAES